MNTFSKTNVKEIIKYEKINIVNGLRKNEVPLQLNLAPGIFIF